jgi:hemoglobin
MKLSLIIALLFPLSAIAADPDPKKPVNEKCPITSKAVDPKITTVYEEVTYAFADQASLEKWKKQRAESIYQEIGGKAAVSATVDKFYVKVLADKSINFFFEDISMKKQHNKQKAFISAALGGPTPWAGKDMRKAHAKIDGITEAHFDAVAGHLQSTLKDLKVKDESIAKIMVVVGSTRADVQGHKNKPAKTKTASK